MVLDGQLADGDLVLALLQAGPGAVDEGVEGHAKVALAAGDEIGLRRVQGRLHGGRDDLDHLDVLAALVVGELRAQRPHERVQGCLGRAVVGGTRDGHKGQARGDGHERDGLGCLCLEVGEEGLDHGNVGCVVGVQLFPH